MKKKLITTQRYRDEKVIEEKKEQILNGKDPVVYYATCVYEGEELTILVGGHHTFSACVELGIEPQYEIEEETQDMIDAQGFETYAEMSWQEDFHYALTGELVW